MLQPVCMLHWIATLHCMQWSKACYICVKGEGLGGEVGWPLYVEAMEGAVLFWEVYFRDLE